MRSFLAALAACCLVTGGAWSAPEECAVAEPPAERPLRLDLVAEAGRAGVVRILVYGTASTGGAGASDQTAAYPAHFAAALRQAWPHLQVDITVRAESGVTAPEMAKRLRKLLAEVRPALVVWQTGTVDAVRGVSLDEFGRALDTGLAAVRGAPANVIMVDSQLGSATAGSHDIQPYLDLLEQWSRSRDVAVFRRHAAMRHWLDEGRIQLAARGSAVRRQTMDFVHRCVGLLLADMVASSAR